MKEEMREGILKIRPDMDRYMRDLRAWLNATKDTPLEEMSAFFAARVSGYEDHMSVWREAYARFAQPLPQNCKTILDLGCGTGLELASVFERFPNAEITGIDLSESMLAALSEKYKEKDISLVCGDYFSTPFGENRYDAVISFESLHHFTPALKQMLFQKIYGALKPNGVFLECDYIACCDEEESLLFQESVRRRTAAGIADGVLVHFDTPLTAAHETALLQNTGFKAVQVLDSIHGATFIRAEK